MKEQISEDIKKKSLDGSFEYEVRMLREGFYHIMKTGVRTPNSNRIDTSNMALIDFLVHTRILYDFFYGSGKGNWSCAGHYKKSWKYKKPPKKIHKWNVQITHFLSHLSYVRITGKYEPYPIDLFYDHFRKLVIDFLSEVPDNYLTTKLKKTIRRIKK